MGMRTTRDGLTPDLALKVACLWRLVSSAPVDAVYEPLTQSMRTPTGRAKTYQVGLRPDSVSSNLRAGH